MPQQMLQLMLQPTLQQTPRLMTLATSSIMQPMLSMFKGMPLQTQDTMQELSLLWSRPIVPREASATA
jgi:hypothetical protein